MYTSKGILRYCENYKLVVDIDIGITNFYLNLIPKYYYVNRQKYPPHISVVRNEVPNNLSVWGKYAEEEIEFYYSPIIQIGKVYCWLNVFCVRLEEIRKELGLCVSSPFTLPPEGFAKCFHTTLGNFKTS